MYRVKKIKNKNVYYSNLLNVEHFFSSRDLIIKDNIELIAQYLNIEPENIIKPIQVHSTNIEIVQKGKYEYKDCDSLILSIKNTAIYLNFADCTPVILYDTKNNIAAIAHAGWRGSSERISAKTVLKMIKYFNSNPEDITALIGPCISFKHFETSNEAIFKLKNSIKNSYGLIRGNYADLKGINKRQLEETGVKKIDICPFCTIDNNDKFFSYRLENKTKNRHSALIKL